LPNTPDAKRFTVLAPDKARRSRVDA